MTIQPKNPVGLDGVVAASTALSQVNGERGELIIAGARVLAFARVLPVLEVVAGMPAVNAFRALAATLRPEDGLSDELVLTGAMAVIAAALVRVESGNAPVPPDPSLGHAADMLRMMRGTPASLAALDAYLVTASDHGMNASTFTA